MFETILWAKAAEKAVESADKISLALIETVMGNLNLLVTIGIGAVGLLVVLALFVVGYNVWVSELTTRKLRKEFEGTIANTKLEFKNKLATLEFVAAGELDRLRVFQYEQQGNFGMVALLASRGLKNYLAAKKIEKSDRFDDDIFIATNIIIQTLDLCMRKDLIPENRDLQEIRKNISELPKILLDKKVQIDLILDELEKKPKKKGGVSGQIEQRILDELEKTEKKRGEKR